MELPEIKALPPMPTLPPMVINNPHTVPMVQVGTKSSVLEFESPTEFTQYMQGIQPNLLQPTHVC